MFKKFTNGCVRVVNRWLPDAFLFAVILSIIVYVGAMLATGMGPLKVLSAWGSNSGFWGLLAFSMQMALVLVLGSAMASAKPCKKALRAVAGMCHNNMQAIVVTTFVSTVCCWLNWGFGLVIGALLAKEVVRRVPTVDYPLLIASAYSGFVIWHAGLSGSIPLDLVAGKAFGDVTYQAPITATVFHPMNLIMCAVILILMPLVNYAMHPDKEHTVTVDPATSAVSGEGEIPTAELHRAIYEARDDINAILYSQAPEVLAVAAMGKTVKPQLDDSAQIIGVSLKCAKNSPKKVVKALKGRHCVLVKDGGALCCGSNESNAGAVEMIAEKSCLTYIGSGLFGKCKPINPIECLLMRVVYLKKYSKQAE